ncbi:hypothetical protein WDV76_19700 [Xenorhabdus griffiniae]|uniref:hypothetical protein n=1 Tax=Xenorhabdus griffiniae TaxID=351672 RepID=UPI0030D222A6
MEWNVLILAYLSGFYIQKNKKCSLENKIAKNYCQRRKIPYNAPPLTDAALKHAATAVREK